jgi:hypothetical protein
MISIFLEVVVVSHFQGKNFRTDLASPVLNEKNNEIVDI